MSNVYKNLMAIVAALVLVAVVVPGAARADVEDDLQALMASANAELEAQGRDIRLGVIEYYTAQDEQGRTVFFRDVGNKQLGHHFVPGDPRRVWSGVGPGDDITWASDLIEGDASVGLGATQGAISAAMATWDNQTCSNIPLTFVATAGDLGFVQFLISGGGSGSPFIFADVTHSGFGTIVDVILPTPTIAATFTFVFIDGAGNLTDIDNNRKLDTALREIYYTNNFPWAINGNIDVETIALHEFGHGLSQAHYGTLFQTDSNGQFHFAPRAVMNAGYTGVQQQLTGTDDGGHCSIWGSWPSI